MNVYENCTDIALNMGRLIRARREEMHLTQEELAGRVNCDVRTLRRWETDGLNKLDTADLVLRELGVNLWDILSERAGIPFLFQKRTEAALLFLFLPWYDFLRKNEKAPPKGRDGSLRKERRPPGSGKGGREWPTK